MAKGTSPPSLFFPGDPRHKVADSIDLSTSALDVEARQPLCPIPESGRNPLIPVLDGSIGDPSSPLGKSEQSVPRASGKISYHSTQKFPHLENRECSGNSLNVAPGKNTILSSASLGAEALLNPTKKVSVQRRQGLTAENTAGDGPPDLSTPPRPSELSAASPVVQASALCGGKSSGTQLVPSSSSRGRDIGAGLGPGTPKSVRAVEASTPPDSETGGSQSQNTTPSKSVSRSLKYSQRPSNSVTSELTSARSTILQPPQAVKGVLPQTVWNHNFAEQNFELEENSNFWRDHNVQVIIRIRPLSSSELAAQGLSRCLKQVSPCTVSWLGQPESRLTFDHVAGETITQARLFEVAGLPMVENCMSGYNSCMFAYGQTGGGKTHTMLGDIKDLDLSPSEERGMTPRVFEYLFSKIRMEQESRRQEHLKFFCRCSFLEIYNEQITDLLEPSSTSLQMREDAKKGVYVENLREVEVHCVQDVIQLLLQGTANKKVASTNMNRESSRSHSVFTCVVESKWESNSMSSSRYGRLHLVDLAGSERQKSSGAEGGRLKEAANINKSLSTLGLVIMILVDVANGKQRHVPYRDSKLTFLLQDSLGGNSKTIMIANVSPSSCCAMETLSTLKFAQRAKFIRNNAVINEAASGDVTALRQQIEQLKVEVERLQLESLSRTPLQCFTRENGAMNGDRLNVPTEDYIEIGCSSPDLINTSKTCSFVIHDKTIDDITWRPAVAERGKAISKRHSRNQQQASEKVGSRTGQEWGISKGNQNHGTALLELGNRVGLEEKEHKCLEMQRWLGRAELQIAEMQTVIDSGAAQLFFEKNNWEADKRKIEKENYARETELHNAIAASELKLLVTEAELHKMAVILADWDTKMHDVENEWMKEIEALAQELTEAKLDASEKRIEATALLQKFQDGQATLKEAEDLVDALVRAYEKAKHHAQDWKSHTKAAALEEDSMGRTQEIQLLDERFAAVDGTTTSLPRNEQSEQLLQLYQQELACAHETLMNMLAYVTSVSDISLQSEELGLFRSAVGKLDHEFRRDFEEMKDDILNFQQAAQEKLHIWRLQINDSEDEKNKLMAQVHDLQLRNSILEDKQDESRHSISVLELMLEEQRKSHSLQMINKQLKAVESDRDKFQIEVGVLNEQLKRAQTLVDECDVVAAEAHQVAQLSISHAEQKEVVAQILGRSVEELESTVYVLESQLGIVKREAKTHCISKEILEKEVESLKHQMESQLGIMNREAERRRVVKDILEKDLEALKLQMLLMQSTIDSQQAQQQSSFEDAVNAKTELDRIVIEMKNQQVQARKTVESLQQECAEKDVQLRSCKAHIAELISGAEKQTSENQQKLKTLESTVEELKLEERKVNPSVGKVVENKVKRAGSPFRCINSGLTQQRASEMDGELADAKRRIREIEAVAASRLKEVFRLNTKLAEAESMTHDVVRDLVGVKTDIASYATLLNQHQVQYFTKGARRLAVEAQQLPRRNQPQAGPSHRSSGLC